VALGDCLASRFACYSWRLSSPRWLGVKAYWKHHVEIGLCDYSIEALLGAIILYSSPLEEGKDKL